MPSASRRIAGHPAVSLTLAVLGGLIEFVALSRSRVGHYLQRKS